MNQQNNIEIVKRIYNCFVNGDLPSMLGYASEDIVFKQPPQGRKPFSGVYIGHDGVIDFFKKVFEVTEFTDFKVFEFYEKDNIVIALGHYKAKSKLNDKEWESDMAEVWKLKDGKILEFEIFKDSAVELLTMPKELA